MAKNADKKKISGKKKGVVVSNSMERAVVVEVTTLKTLKKYHKKYRDSKRYCVHDESNSHVIGDRVFFEECRPLSKTKKWRIVQEGDDKKTVVDKQG